MSTGITRLQYDYPNQVNAHKCQIAGSAKPISYYKSRCYLMKIDKSWAKKQILENKYYISVKNVLAQSISFHWICATNDTQYQLFNI